MARTSIIALHIDGLTHLIPAKTIKVSALEIPLPLCAWCEADDLMCQIEYIELGFFADKHTLFCGCPNCQNATVVVYELVDKETHYHVETK